METKISCPFCGEVIHLATHPSLTSANGEQCPLLGYSFSWSQWSMRPPRKEQPAMPVESEVHWLRGLVEKLVIQEPAQEITYNVMPGEQGKAQG